MSISSCREARRLCSPPVNDIRLLSASSGICQSPDRHGPPSDRHGPLSDRRSPESTIATGRTHFVVELPLIPRPPSVRPARRRSFAAPPPRRSHCTHLVRHIPLRTGVGTNHPTEICMRPYGFRDSDGDGRQTLDRGRRRTAASPLNG